MGTLASGSIDLKALKVAGEPNKYITKINDNGITVHAANNSSLNYVAINANGMEIFKSNGASTPSAISVAQFGDTVRIGNILEAKLELDYHSLQLIDKEGNTYLHISDLRDTTGTGMITEIQHAGENTTTFNLYYTCADVSRLVVKLSETTLSDSDFESKTTSNFTLKEAPGKGTKLEIIYPTASHYAKAFTWGNRASDSGLGAYSYAEGYNITSNGRYTHAEGSGTRASGTAAHAEGDSTKADAMASHAEGNDTSATGLYSHSEGDSTWAGSTAAHAEGSETEAVGAYSHTEGQYSYASGIASHAEGEQTYANGNYSHTEGYNTIVATASSGSYSGAHAEGYQTRSAGIAAHAEGYLTKASSNYQHVQGVFNVEDTNSTYADIVGWGTADNARKNIFALSTGGVGRFKGNVYVGCNDDSTGGNKLSPVLLSGVADNQGSVVIGDLVMEWGLVSITTGSSGTTTGGLTQYLGTAQVTFTNTFAYKPNVTLTWAANYNNQSVLNTYDVTTTGFYAYGRTLTGSTTRNIRWIAIGKKA